MIKNNSIHANCKSFNIAIIYLENEECERQNRMT